MCTTCGCGPDTPHGHDHEHGHGHDHDHDATPGGRLIRLERDILADNDRLAAANRARLRDGDVLALNLLSSPGSGKTTLLERTVARLAGRLPIAVIEGDQQTDADAARIRAAGAPAVQINTGKGCHLDARMVGLALDGLALPEGGILFVENVGNLVCPAAFDLGEAAKVVIVSVTEGDDKPLKYPDMFAAARLVVINKLDLVAHVDCDLDRLTANIRRVNPAVEVIALSARSDAGLDAWIDWLARRRPRLAAPPLAA
ncbi:hydrogenase accessory protein HypB [Siculibacillus lacustris]|uniref:Hydrogenase maturation factor HypB n=1 Tax=Siculibacillus lacustris TaxID=1549641 RepID=A0A4V6MZ51_9HYPH|nr:hydrogenase nickel incorporation protein HypB [Siculibacillus lacustris]TBW40335.1 hydrogenase accessory protein HypB [Siculibacillus lacustris]